MSELLRDTAFGHLIRLVFGKRYFQYSEEKDPELWKKYLHEEKSGYVAHHGTVEPHADGEDSDTEEPPTPGIGGVRTRDDRAREDAEVYDSTSSSHTCVNDNGATYNMASGRKIDPEKGRDLYIVEWNGPDDPEVRYKIHRGLHSSVVNLAGAEPCKLVAEQEVLCDVRKYIPRHRIRH